MRSAPFLAIIAIGVTAFAKEPPSSRSLSERLANPEEKEFNLQQMSPMGRSKSEFQARDANTKSFYIQQKYQAKDYDTEPFRTKSAWDGNFKFSTKDARTKPFETNSAPVKSAAVKEARDGGKSVATREFAESNRESAFKGRNQALFDKEGPAAQAKVGASWRTSNGDRRFSIGGQDGLSWAGNLKQLSVDDVRQILNKNK